MILSLALSAAIAALFALLLRSLRLGEAPWRVPMISVAVGACAGLVVVIFGIALPGIVIVIAAAAVLACLLAHQDDATITEGALSGSTVATVAALAVLIDGSRAAFPLVAATTAGAVAGAAWTLPDRRRFVRFLGSALATAGVVVAAEFFEQAAIDSAVAIPLSISVIALTGLALFGLRMRSLKPILLEEAEWGIVEPDLVRHLVSPWRRLFRPSGFDREMWRELARTAHRLAHRRLRQRRMSAEAARVQQLEVVRLRTRLIDLQRIRLENLRAATEPPLD